jgi:hypothetical protein
LILGQGVMQGADSETGGQEQNGKNGKRAAHVRSDEIRARTKSAEGCVIPASPSCRNAGAKGCLIADSILEQDLHGAILAARAGHFMGGSRGAFLVLE